MRTLLQHTSALRSSILTMVALVLATATTWAQMPQNLPNDPDPVELDSLLKIVVFIVVPVLLIISLFFWRRWSRKNKAENERETSGEEEKE